MKRLTKSPWFYVIFILASAGIHGLMLFNGAFGLEISESLYQRFMETVAQHPEKPFAAGPLIFSFFELFFKLFQDPATGFFAGALVLIATITHVILKLLSRLGAPPWLLWAAGLWVVISPSLQWLSISHPQILLGLVFLLLSVFSLTRRNYFLLGIFLIHLFLTHYLLAGFSLILLAGYVIKLRVKKNRFFEEGL